MLSNYSCKHGWYVQYKNKYTYTNIYIKHPYPILNKNELNIRYLILSSQKA